MKKGVLYISCIAFFLVACGGGKENENSENGHDGRTDAHSDTGKNADPSGPLPGFGAISGSCWVLDDEEWQSEKPFIYRNSIDFGTDEYDPALLSSGGNYIATHDNAGGSSVESEAIAFEMLYRCEGAEFLKGETEVAYKDAGGKITDILVQIDGRKVGVSVTRAFAYQGEYTLEEATRLLTKKLADLPLSMDNAKQIDRWERSMLSVIAFDDAAAAQIEAAFEQLDADIKGDAIIMLTVSNGNDAFIY